MLADVQHAPSVCNWLVPKAPHKTRLLDFSIHVCQSDKHQYFNIYVLTEGCWASAASDSERLQLGGPTMVFLASLDVFMWNSQWSPAARMNYVVISETFVSCPLLYNLGNPVIMWRHGVI